jgi:hypothetical protein
MIPCFRARKGKHTDFNGLEGRVCRFYHFGDVITRRKKNKDRFQMNNLPSSNSPLGSFAAADGSPRSRQLIFNKPTLGWPTCHKPVCNRASLWKNHIKKVAKKKSNQLTRFSDMALQNPD